MKDAINFVKHAITNRMFDEIVTEIHFCEECIQSNNGIVVMRYPINNKDTYSVRSSQLVKAVEQCDYTPKIRLTEKNVIITKGQFRALLPYRKEYTETILESGIKIKLKKPLLPAIKKLFPFISEDASREWSQSLKAKDGWLYATNNIVIARVKTPLPDIVLPIQLVAVLLKVGEEPKSLTVGKKTISVGYSNEAWIQCQAATMKWPATEHIFKGYKGNKIPKVSKSFLEALESSKHFVVDDIINITNNSLVTDLCVVDKVMAGECKLSSANIRKVVTMFTHIDFGAYPKPLTMKGEGIQGMMAGIF